MMDHLDFVECFLNSSFPTSTLYFTEYANGQVFSGRLVSVGYDFVTFVPIMTLWVHTKESGHEIFNPSGILYDNFLKDIELSYIEDNFVWVSSSLGTSIFFIWVAVRFPNGLKGLRYIHVPLILGDKRRTKNLFRTLEEV